MYMKLPIAIEFHLVLSWKKEKIRGLVAALLNSSY